MKEQPQKSNRLRFNIVDVFLIVIALGAVATLVLMFSSYRSELLRAEQKKAETEYQLQISSALAEYKGLIQIGDRIRDADTDADIGEVIDVVYADVNYRGTDAEGNLVYTPCDEQIRITVTVRATASVDDIGSYRIGELALKLGKTVSFRVPDFTGSGTCISVREVSENE